MLNLNPFSINPLTAVLLGSLLLNGVTGFISYRLYGTNKLLEANIEMCKAANDSLLDSLRKEKAVCEVSDRINVELITENKQQEQAKKDAMDSIDRMSRKPSNHSTTGEISPHADKDTYVDIDDTLPPELIRVLDGVHQNIPR